MKSRTTQREAQDHDAKLVAVIIHMVENGYLLEFVLRPSLPRPHLEIAKCKPELIQALEIALPDSGTCP